MASMLKMKFCSCPHPQVAPPRTAATSAAAPVHTFRRTKPAAVFLAVCNATRRLRDDDEQEGEEENEEIAALEKYSESKSGEALLVQAQLDQELVQLLIYKGYSSCLNRETNSDPSRSILPARSVIKRIDRVKAPFDPANIHYIQKGLTLYDLL